MGALALRCLLALAAQPPGQPMVPGGAGVRPARAGRLDERHRKGRARTRAGVDIKDVFLNWQLGHTFGWGVMGLNVFSHWATDPLVRPVMGGEITRESLGVCDPMRLCRLYPAIEYSNRFVAGMRKSPDGTYRMDATM